jgi:ferredoxin
MNYRKEMDGTYTVSVMDSVVKNIPTESLAKDIEQAMWECHEKGVDDALMDDGD